MKMTSNNLCRALAARGSLRGENTARRLVSIAMVGLFEGTRRNPANSSQANDIKHQFRYANPLPARGRGWERGLHELSKPPLLASPPNGGEEYEGGGEEYEREEAEFERQWSAALCVASWPAPDRRPQRGRHQTSRRPPHRALSRSG